MLPIPTESQNDTIPSTTGRDHRATPTNNDRKCFVSPITVTAKKSKRVKIALEACKLNESCVEKEPIMPTIEEL